MDGCKIAKHKKLAKIWILAVFFLTFLGVVVSNREGFFCRHRRLTCFCNEATALKFYSWINKWGVTWMEPLWLILHVHIELKLCWNRTLSTCKVCIFSRIDLKVHTFLIYNRWEIIWSTWQDYSGSLISVPSRFSAIHLSQTALFSLLK